MSHSGPLASAARISRSFQTSRLGSILRPGPIGVALLVVAFLLHVPTLDQPLLETQNWRQTHTAYNALIFYEKGIDLFRPQLPLFGVPFEFPIEFPIFQALASLVMGLGIAPDDQSSLIDPMWHERRPAGG